MLVDAHGCTVELVASLGERGTSGTTMDPCVFLTLLGHESVLENWRWSSYNSEKLGRGLYLLGMRVLCVFKLETVEIKWWLTLLRRLHQWSRAGFARAMSCPRKGG